MEDLENRQSKYELKAILDSSRLLIESHDYDFIINNLMLNIMGKLLISKSAVFLKIPNTSDFYATHTKGRLTFQKDFTFTWDLPDYINRSAFYTFKNDEVYPGILFENQLKTILHIKTNDQYLGFILLGPKLNGKELSKREIEFISGLVIISSVSIANSRLFKDLKSTNRMLDKKVQELHTLFDLSQEFSTTIDREQIVKIFKFALLGQMFIRSFFLVYEKNNELLVLARNGIPKDFDEAKLISVFEKVNEVHHIVEGSSIADDISDLNMKLMLPLNLQEKKKAVLVVGGRANNEEFTDADINFLFSLGNLVLMSIQKTYLLEEQIEKERIEKELTIAKSIQEKLLPDKIPQFPKIEIAGLNEPSRFVGGDYFDIIESGENKATVAIADVTGKGVPASLIMANLQAMLHLLNSSSLPITEMTGRINDIIFKNTPPDIFITFVWGKLNALTQELTYVNAGHNPPLHYCSKSGEVKELTTGGLLIGALQTIAPYQSETIKLEKGDILLLFTDGVTEAMDENSEEFGEEKLIEIIKNKHHLNAEDLKNLIVSEVKAFCDNKLGDDLTMIILKVY